MAIAGILVQTDTDAAEAVWTRLSVDPHIAEAHRAEIPGRMVAVLEADSDRMEQEFKRLAAWDGVLSVDLAYLTYEDELADGGAIKCPPWEPRHRSA
ncbi:chaperone NapD [Nitratidesulfovibrio termitidis]|uniref:chaperone NapD n=1 Tax=Nitratidesulfovibrio termitidis TaxID=42252 RepID=UPI00040013C6|nr:chaperone NapD [Nitratidesulfovibrio termitidis]